MRGTAGRPRFLYTAFRSALGSSTFAYALRVGGGGAYTVRLHFAEINAAAARRGRRAFSVSLEGVRVLANYDIYADVGANVATVKTFTTVVTDGVLDIGFHSVVGNAVVMGIEVDSAPRVTHPSTPPPTASPTPTTAPPVAQAPAAQPTLDGTPAKKKSHAQKSHAVASPAKSAHAKSLAFQGKDADNPAEAASCNARQEDCIATEAAIADRYLNRQCVPHRRGGMLVATASTLTDSISAVRAYGCCARQTDRIKLLRMARLLASTDTCADADTAPLPSGVVTTSPTNTTTVPSDVAVPPVGTSVAALELLGLLGGPLAPGMAASDAPEAAPVAPADTAVAPRVRQHTRGASRAGSTGGRLRRRSARASVVLDFRRQPVGAGGDARACCGWGTFNYNGDGCCDTFCWTVADIFPFFTLHECCVWDLRRFEHCP